MRRSAPVVVLLLTLMFSAGLEAATKKPRGLQRSTSEATTTGASEKEEPSLQPTPATGSDSAETSPSADDSTDAPLPARAKYLPRVANLVTAQLKLQPPLKPSDVREWGIADVDGNKTLEYLFSWSQGRVSGGVAVTTSTPPNIKLLAIILLKDPVLQVRPIALAGDRTRHLLVRLGADNPEGGSRRRMVILAATPEGLKKIWEHTDQDNIAGNQDLSEERHAMMSEVSFEEGIGGRPGSLTPKISRFVAPPGKGPEATLDKGQEIQRFLFDRQTRRLVPRKTARATEDTPDSSVAQETSSAPESESPSTRSQRRTEEPPVSEAGEATEPRLPKKRKARPAIEPSQDAESSSEEALLEKPIKRKKRPSEDSSEETSSGGESLDAVK